jgi:hypothetical protein
MFQDKPLHCYHTLLKIKNLKAILSATRQGSLEIPTDLNVLQVWLYPVQKLSTFSCRQMCTVKKI